VIAGRRNAPGAIRSVSFRRHGLRLQQV